jgi:Flp pilus assembly pilin Flp
MWKCPKGQGASIASSAVMTIVWAFGQDDRGQDLIEYTLMIAFVALASAILFIGAGSSISGIWGASNTQLTAANTSAS